MAMINFEITGHMINVRHVGLRSLMIIIIIFLQHHISTSSPWRILVRFGSPCYGTNPLTSSHHALRNRKVSKKPMS
jgi:hypothetical protein